MSQPALGFSLDLEFWEAIEAARARGVVLPDEFYDGIPADARRTAFTVSHLNSLGQIQVVLDKLAQALQEGRTLVDFQEWAKGQNFDLTDWHLETVFRTGVQTAYNAGHWRHFVEHASDRPFLMYDAINDSRTRPHHAACDGIIRAVGDPFWRDHSPPLGFNCRCSLISLSEAQAKARSKGGKGLNKPEDADMRSDGAGWGGSPLEHSEALDKLMQQRLGKTSSSVRQAYNDRMKSEQAAIRWHDLIDPGLNAVQQEARDFVVRYGKETGNEYGVAVVGGTIKDTFTSNTPSRLIIPFIEAEPRSVDIHHNHTIGDSLSRADFLVLFARKELSSVFVHGHNGATYRATKLLHADGDSSLSLDEMLLLASNKLIKAVKLRMISEYDAQSGMKFVLLALMLVKDGAISYSFNSPQLIELANRIVDL